MNCKEARRLLVAQADAELRGEQAAELARHLAGCAACRAEFEALKQDAVLLRSEPAVEAPEGISRAALERIRRPRRPLFLPVWQAAAAAVVVAAGLWFGIVLGNVLTGPEFAFRNCPPAVRAEMQKLMAGLDRPGGEM